EGVKDKSGNYVACTQVGLQKNVTVDVKFIQANNVFRGNSQQAMVFELHLFAGRGNWEYSKDPHGRKLCVRRYSPLVLNLTGDAMKMIGPASKEVVFDLNGDGTLEYIGWPAKPYKDDHGNFRQVNALLVRDVNGNGKIDDGTELFGTATKMPDGSTA